MAAIEPYSPSDLVLLSQHVGRVIKAGGLVALPTETYYGLAVDPFAAPAVERLLSVKGRGDGKPILLVIGDRTQLSALVQDVTPVAELLMETFWPGALTILFAAHPALPDNLTAGTGTIGVRFSSCLPLVQLLQRVGPLTGTSANRSGAPPARTAGDVQGSLGHDVDLIIDAGMTPGGLPSTVIDARGPVHVVRDGPISRQMLQDVLQTRGISLSERA